MATGGFLDFETCAVRRADGEGWGVVDIVGKPAAVDARLAAMSLVPGSLRRITSGICRADAPSIKRLSFDDAFDRTCGTAWSWDERTQCWRAPDEALLPAPIEPVVSPFDVTFQPPDAGWLNTKFTAGPQSLVCALSNVFDPLRHLVAWLEQVASGGNPRFCCDLEGSELEFNLWPHTDDLRIAIAHNTRLGRIDKIDAVIPRDAFVRSFYLSLIAFWESPALSDNWRQWASYTDMEGIDVDENGCVLRPYRLRSAALDRLIGTGGPDDGRRL